MAWITHILVSRSYLSTRVWVPHALDVADRTAFYYAGGLKDVKSWVDDAYRPSNGNKTRWLREHIDEWVYQIDEDDDDE